MDKLTLGYSKEKYKDNLTVNYLCIGGLDKIMLVSSVMLGL